MSKTTQRPKLRHVQMRSIFGASRALLSGEKAQCKLTSVKIFQRWLFFFVRAKTHVTAVWFKRFSSLRELVRLNLTFRVSGLFDDVESISNSNINYTKEYCLKNTKCWSIKAAQWLLHWTWENLFSNKGALRFV